MNFIRGTVATAVLMILLLPSSQTAINSSNTDETSPKTEVENVQNEDLHNNDEFKCSAGQKIPFSKVCDGTYDCRDRSDENCYPGKCSEIVNCHCTPTNRCLQQNQSYFHLFYNFYYLSNLYLHVKPGEEMILDCPKRHQLSSYLSSEAVNWYRNDMGVPSKCQITTPTQYNPVSRLHCRNMTTDDEGLYYCERYYSSFNFDIRIAVFVKEQSFFELDSCFCFGAETNCQKTNTTINSEDVQMLSGSSPPILLSMQDDLKTINPNYTIFEGRNIETISQSEADGTVYYALSEKITKMKLELYGGSFSYKLFKPFEEPTIKNRNAPLAVMRGDDKVLVYRESGNSGENSQSKKLSFSKHNWHILHNNTVTQESASAADVMRVLGNLDEIYVRVHYNVNNFVVNYTTVELSLVKFSNDGSGWPSSIGKCSCPPEYTGNYCEKCAANYTGNPVKNTSCVPRGDELNFTAEEGHEDSTVTPGSIDVENLQNNGSGNDSFLCDGGKMIPSSKVCDGRIDCSNGKDEICYSGRCGDINKCQCAHTKQCIERSSSHFYLFSSQDYAMSNIHVNLGDSMILECPFTDDSDDYGTVWYQNNMDVPEKCQIANPTQSDLVSRLHCSNMTMDDKGVYSCERGGRYSRYSFDVAVFVGDETTYERDCFCFGVSNTCENPNVTVKHQELKFSKSLLPILLAPPNEKGETILNETIFEGRTIEEVSESNINDTVYYGLSEEITTKKLDLYGGSISYKFHEFINHYKLLKHEKTPLALMRGGNKVLAYYESREANKHLFYKRLSFTKHNWYFWNENTASRKRASESDVMMVLSNLNEIYVRVHCGFGVRLYEHRWEDLFMIEFANNGLDIIPSTIGKCFCPLGYTGAYCERCADTYIGDPTKNISCVYATRHVKLEESVMDDSYVNEGRNNTDFECNNGVIIEFTKVCDGILDCVDGADEKCTVGACDSFNECKCAATNKCIRRNETDFYLFKDDGDVPLNLVTLPGQPLTLQCPTLNADDTKWYWNKGTVPPDCTTANYTDRSTLSCPNVTSVHGGVYSCERYYNSSEETIQAAVLVGEEAFYKQSSCFCFGADVTSCEIVNISTSFKYFQKFKSSSAAAVLAAPNGHLTLFLIEDKASEVDELNGAVYYALSNKIIDEKLQLYGGFIPFGSVQVEEKIGETNISAPHAVMYGDGTVLLHYQDGKYGTTMGDSGLIFSAPNWIVLHKDGTVGKVTARGMMKVLSHLDAIYVSEVPVSHDYENISSKVHFGSTELGTPLPDVPKCSCPAGYIGTYCEKCAENFTGDPMNDASCIPIIAKMPMDTIATSEEIDEENLQNEVVETTDQPNDDFMCSDNLRLILSSEVCDENINCRDGSDEICFYDDSCNSNECKCANTGQCISRHRSQFYLFESRIYSTPYFTAMIGDSMILVCPIVCPIYSFTLEKPIKWYQNDKNVPSKCQITQPTESNWVSQLTCPNITVEDQGVYSCEENYMGEYHNRDVIAYVEVEDSHAPEPCFCFGITTTCQRTYWEFDRKTVNAFSNSSILYLPTSETNEEIVVPNSKMFENGNLGTEALSQTNAIPYYPLSEEVINMKLKLLGGYITYKISYDSRFDMNKKIAPLAIMRGDDKMLVYYDEGIQYNETWYYPVKLDFSMYKWFTLHGETKGRASQEDFMRVLNNLDGIYVRMFYDFKDIRLHTLEYDHPSTAIKCSCPTGYDGNYCERCAENYLGDPVNGKSCVPMENTEVNTESSLQPNVTDDDYDRDDDDDDVILTTLSPLSGSSPKSSQFLYRSFESLALYFCSLCCSIWWYRFI